MPSVEEFARAMEWWCRYGDLGYDQANRWSLRVGGETDCSALIIGVLDKCGFDTGNATYTGNMAANLTAHGWEMLDPGVDKQRGDILLSHANHVACYLGDGLVAQASIDERGDIAGGQSGDQADETNVHLYYDYPWDCVLRYAGGDTSTVSTYGGGSVTPQLAVQPSVDGYWGEETTRMLQGVLGTTVDGEVSSQAASNRGYLAGCTGGWEFVADAWADGSQLIASMQAALGVEADGIMGPGTVNALSARYGLEGDGHLDAPSATIRAMQERLLNGGW